MAVLRKTWARGTSKPPRRSKLQQQAILFSAARKFRARGASEAEMPTPMEFYISEVAGLKEYSGGWAWGICPFHDDHTPSLAVNLDSGYFKCHSPSCGAHGNGIVSFVMLQLDVSWMDAVKYLKEWSWTQS